MSGGTGVDFVDQGINAAANVFTAGFVGYGDNGLKVGKQGKLMVQGVKEVTGAKAAEEANILAQEQVDAQAAAAKQDRENAQLQNQQNQIMASQGASSSAARRNTNNKTSRSQIGDVTDFLGI